MRFLKIMGIFTSILSLLSCGHGNKRVTQNDGINSNIPVAARITIDKLPDVLRNVQAGRKRTSSCQMAIESIIRHGSGHKYRM